MTPLDPAHLEALAAADPKIAPLTVRFGHIQYRLREEGFPALLRLIVEQQLSVKAADTITARLHAGLGEVSPAALLSHDDDLMRGYGLSRPKIAYARALAEARHSGAFDTERLNTMATEDAAAALVALKGIGRWTAEMFLIFNLSRPDVLPLDDLGLIRAISVNYFSGEPVTRSEAREVAANWEPWRTVATWYMWRSLDGVAE